MDWNKTKTIFIIVFSILNIFLYFLYSNRYNEAQDVEILGESSIEERLQADNIRFDNKTEGTDKESYVSGNIRVYEPEELKPLDNQTFDVFDRTRLVSTFEEPVWIGSPEDSASLAKFVTTNVYDGTSYELFDIDEEDNKAVFFQTVNNRAVFFNQNAQLTVFWNEEDQIIRYEQTALEELEDFEQTENLLPDERAVEVLYQRNLLKPNSTIESINLGYSTLVQLTETQVFAPTWRVRVKLQDGSKEDYFVNAVEGKIIEFNKESTELEEE